MEKSKSEQLSTHVRDVIDDALTMYPPEQKQSAVLTALREVQHENGGHLTMEFLDAVATYLDMPPIAVYEVATFYSMFELKPVGRHSISVCTNISCMLRGADDVVEYIENKLGTKTGESTSDGRFYLKQEEECLAACCGGPMMMVDHKYYENLTLEKVDEILDKIE
ncbi:MAG: NAD(P)H-dependent oxidoreductase subunit E [Gammaproteobacteria bacterium]